MLPRLYVLLFSIWLVCYFCNVIYVLCPLPLLIIDRRYSVVLLFLLLFFVCVCCVYEWEELVVSLWFCNSYYVSSYSFCLSSITPICIDFFSYCSVIVHCWNVQCTGKFTKVIWLACFWRISPMYHLIPRMMVAFGGRVGQPTHRRSVPQDRGKCRRTEWSFYRYHLTFHPR